MDFRLNYRYLRLRIIIITVMCILLLFFWTLVIVTFFHLFCSPDLVVVLIILFLSFWTCTVFCVAVRVLRQMLKINYYYYNSYYLLLVLQFMVYLTTLCVTQVISHENVGSLVKMYYRVCELNQSRSNFRCFSSIFFEYRKKTTGNLL
jgi:hypothetical protein